jgi:hypothetical protein
MQAVHALGLQAHQKNKPHNDSTDGCGAILTCPIASASSNKAGRSLAVFIVARSNASFCTTTFVRIVEVVSLYT